MDREIEIKEKGIHYAWKGRYNPLGNVTGLVTGQAIHFSNISVKNY